MEKNYCKVEERNGEYELHLYCSSGAPEKLCSVALFYADFCRTKMKECEECNKIAEQHFGLIKFIFEEAGLSDLLNSFLEEVKEIE